MTLTGRQFHKMSGSGNDFVFFDARGGAIRELEDADVVGRLCARGTGIGADGVVSLLAPASGGDVRIRYLNRDGSVAALCGNATLCAARLTTELGAVRPNGFRIETDSGVLSARITDRGLPEIDLEPVEEITPETGFELAAGEERMGYAIAGVPHLVIPVRDVAAVDVTARGRPLRYDPRLPLGANVNFVQPAEGGGWRIRTYERGVEEETLACGTGAVATAVLLTLWGKANGPVVLETRSGRALTVRLTRSGDRLHPSLSGEARIVFHGSVGEL